jgi:hypothetical protein
VLSVVEGLLDHDPDSDCARSCPFRKVFRAVGDVADSVSNLRLVEPFPNIGVTLEVLSVNFGRFEGDGDSRYGAEGRMVRDIVLGPAETWAWTSNCGGGCGIKASMVSQPQDCRKKGRLQLM